ncbi:MAG: LLM class flavin-dependent oxidoreductase [Wenzhouxiangellaceae bacterium]
MGRLKFHWASPLDSGQQKAAGDYSTGAFDLEGLIEFSQAAESAGISSLLMGISYHMPDPIALIGALARETTTVKFILAYRPGLVSPTLFAQMVNTISWINNGRIDLNIVAGISPAEQAYYGDYCDHAQRYRRTSEFLQIASQLWSADQPVSYDGEFYRITEAELGLSFKDNRKPFIYLSGGSSAAQQVAARHADCLLRYGDAPDKLKQQAQEVHASGIQFGIRMHVIARETQQQAHAFIAEMMRDPDEAHKAEIADFVAKCDSEAVRKSFDLAEQAEGEWLTPMIWSGAVAYRGGPALSIVGSYQQVAEYLLEYRRAGIDEFILSGWPTRDEMERFCKEVLPRYHELEDSFEAVL